MMKYRSKGVLLTFPILGSALAQSGYAAEEPGLGPWFPRPK